MNLNQVTISVKNIDKSIAFYEQLGLKLIVKTPDYARFECPEGDATFSLLLNPSNRQTSNTQIYFEVENVDEKIKELLKKGIAIEQLPELKEWLWKEAVLKDPDNNQIIIYHAGENRKNPPWRIK